MSPMSVRRVKPPRPGDGATMLLLSDRKPVTVLSIEDDQLLVQEDRVIAMPGGLPSMEPNPSGRCYWFGWDADQSAWRQTKGPGGPVMRAGSRLHVGRREYFLDPQFLCCQTAAA